ncbi:MAG: helix-turn-helix transcriptional regulator [Clostridia bacterium]|nr:helix-turn-helix transcriptional regulator [Clostridia bacterium]
MVKFAEKLKNLRLEKGLSQKSVALSLGVSPTCYAGYEQGYREPDLTTLRKLCLFFGTSADYLLGITEFDSL